MQAFFRSCTIVLIVSEIFGRGNVMAEIKIGRMVLGVCQTNCYFLYREGEHDAIVVDPADKGANIYAALQKNGSSRRSGG